MFCKNTKNPGEWPDPTDSADDDSLEVDLRRQRDGGSGTNQASDLGTIGEMKKSAQYRKIVEWSEEDRCYVGRCTELMFGGVHGKNEQKVFAELCAVIEEWIEISEKCSVQRVTQ